MNCTLNNYDPNEGCPGATGTCIGEGPRAGLSCTDFNSDATTGCPGGTCEVCIAYCSRDPIPPLNNPIPEGFCSNPFPYWGNPREDYAMTVYQARSGAWVFNAATLQWSWGLDDYFTGLSTPDGADNGPALRPQCGYPWFHPGLVSCRSAAIEQITRNVLDRFIAPRPIIRLKLKSSLP